MRLLASLFFPLALLACNNADQSVAAFVDPGSSWKLSALNGAPFLANATIAFPAAGRVTGQGPCNGYTAQQTAPYPWIEIKAIGATKMACSQMAEEQVFFNALTKVTIAEVAGTTLILSAENDIEMVFTRL